MEREGFKRIRFGRGVMDMLPQNSRSREGMFRRSAAAECAASNSVGLQRVAVREGVPRVLAVEEEGKEQMEVSFLGRS